MNRSRRRTIADKTGRVFKMLISIVIYLFDLSWAAISASIAQRSRLSGCVCLYFHGIQDIERDRFAAQLDLLKRHALLIRPDSIGRHPPAQLSVIVTFDDGFQSVVRNAIPSLLSRGIPSTHFIPAGLVGTAPCWDGAQEYNPHPETVMDVATLGSLSPELIVIGSHTATHPVLPDLGADEILAELQRSRELLRHYTGQAVDFLSFPYGRYDDRCIALARVAGYQRGFTVNPWSIDETASTFTLGRVKVSPTDWQLEFFLKFSGAYRWLAYASLYKQKLRQRCAVLQRVRLRPEPRSPGA